ncbi:NADH:flavin oxidoreductase/NADH oxidase [Apiospora arundinis]|uniref:NADH:flavin oxidoreductase/NADH oxidase n=1 Tax=Apiospora arundinis TaxID=335852 RepID=A0ABR2HLU2_9PEZI
MMELNISKPLTLRCGLTLPNRLVKAAMAEGFADVDQLPASQKCLAVYGEWAKGGWGLVITGNVQVDVAHLGDPGDIAVNASLTPERTAAAFKTWAATCKGANGNHDAKAVVQLCHPGRQIAFKKDKIAPSAVPMDFGTALVPRLLNALVFGTPRAMTLTEICDVVRRFAEAARVVAEAGFAGVELHAAHGYLLAQFLSAKSNTRTDEYGGGAVARARIVVEIVHAIRDAVPLSEFPGFCIGIKLNSVDVGSVEGLRDCLEQVRVISEAGIDFLEVSGGSFEDPTFNTGLGPGSNAALPVEKKKASTLAREAFFIEFATVIRERFPQVPLVVTGGFRSRRGMEAALAEGDCDLIGLARPAIMDPLLPRTTLLNGSVPDEQANIDVKRIPPSRFAQLLGVKLLGVAPERDWYTHKMHRIGSLKGSIVILGASSGPGHALVDRILSEPSAATEYYGLYFLDKSQDARSFRKSLAAKSEARQHACKIVELDFADPVSVRKAAGEVNQLTAMGAIPPIRALVIGTGAVGRKANVASLSHISPPLDDTLSRFLLTLMLLQSMDAENGKVVIFDDEQPATRLGTSYEFAKERQSLLEKGSWGGSSSAISQELAQHLEKHPELNGVPVAKIDMTSSSQSNNQGTFGQMLSWILTIIFFWLSRGPAHAARDKSAAEEALRVVLDYKNGIYVSAAAISGEYDEEKGDEQADVRRRVWSDLVQAACIQDAHTVL